MVGRCCLVLLLLLMVALLFLSWLAATVPWLAVWSLVGVGAHADGLIGGSGSCRSSAWLLPGTSLSVSLDAG